MATGQEELPLLYTSLFCNHYEHGDGVGRLLAYVSLVPPLLILLQLVVVYCRREIHQAVIFAGFIANEAAARGVKHCVRQARPSGSCARLRLCDSYGMPSSHTQCAAFAASLALLLLLRCVSGSYGGSSNARGGSSSSAAAGGGGGARIRLRGFALCWRVLEVAALVGVTVAVAISRVYLGYHTSLQVAVGAVLGVMMGVLCRVVLGAAAPYYSALADAPLLRQLLFKNTWSLEQPLVYERAAVDLCSDPRSTVGKAIRAHAIGSGSGPICAIDDKSD